MGNGCIPAGEPSGIDEGPAAGAPGWFQERHIAPVTRFMRGDGWWVHSDTRARVWTPPAGVRRHGPAGIALAVHDPARICPSRPVSRRTRASCARTDP